MKIAKATRSYEQWLGRQIPLLREDVQAKHELMAADLFAFLRATYYRWAQLWPEVCPEPARAPKLLAVGDLHIENFGTWRDREGRLVWGVNDFDEASPLAYTVDLVRLTASVEIALAAAHLALGMRQACDAILSGYSESLQKGGEPIVLGEHHHWLRELATSALRDPALFWAKLNALPAWRGRLPQRAARALKQALPQRGLEYRVVHRQSGLGSLGRRRFLALADWRGGKVAREVKELTTSAALWARQGRTPKKILYAKILDQAVRCPDPFLELRGNWIVRRLAPDCCRVELAELPAKRDEGHLLWHMGWETANVHLGQAKRIADVKRDLARRPPHWLYEASTAMTQAIRSDWQRWKSRRE